MVNSIKVVVADDMEAILLYLDKVISDAPEFEIVGKAKNGNELIELVVKNEPQVVITDIEMPECNGIEAIEKLNRQGIKTKYIIITGNTCCMLTAKEKQLGILKVIKKPILDDKKFIEQIREVIMLEEKQVTSEELRMPQIKKENILIKIINKFFKSK